MNTIAALLISVFGKRWGGSLEANNECIWFS